MTIQLSIFSIFPITSIAGLISPQPIKSFNKLIFYSTIPKSEYNFYAQLLNYYKSISPFSSIYYSYLELISTGNGIFFYFNELKYH